MCNDLPILSEDDRFEFHGSKTFEGMRGTKITVQAVENQNHPADVPGDILMIKYGKEKVK